MLAGMEPVERLRRDWIGEAQGLLVTAPENRRYLSGFRGSAGALLVTGDAQVIVADGRYFDQAREQSPAFRTVLQERSLLATAVHEAAALGVRTLRFEAQALTFGAFRELQGLCDAQGITPDPMDDPVSLLRRVKTDAELDTIRRACEIACEAFEHATLVIRPGITERTVAWEVERCMREAGAEAIKANHVIASGPRGALPHGQATDRILERGDLITLDIGARVDGYYSDMTRTFAIGAPDDRAREVYALVLQAGTRALAGLRAGLICEDVDREVRTFFGDCGVGEYFRHSLGHTIGLELHERPRLAPGDLTVLEAGMVTSVEPGLYFPGWGGVRIEDLVVIGPDGVENLCRFPKELLEL